MLNKINQTHRAQTLFDFIQIKFWSRHGTAITTTRKVVQFVKIHPATRL